MEYNFVLESKASAFGALPKLKLWTPKSLLKIMMKIENIFNALKTSSAEEMTEEVFEKLLSTPYFTLERIVSTGQSTPPGQWYDQTQDEWVILLSGSAELSFETEKTEKTVQVLHPGDYIHIPAHQRHRVSFPDSSQPTVWLALHYRNKEY